MQISNFRSFEMMVALQLRVRVSDTYMHQTLNSRICKRSRFMHYNFIRDRESQSSRNEDNFQLENRNMRLAGLPARTHVRDAIDHACIHTAQDNFISDLWTQIEWLDRPRRRIGGRARGDVVLPSRQAESE